MMVEATESSSNVVPFRNISQFIEQLVEFAGKHKGIVSFRAENENEFEATLSFPEQNKSLVVSGESFHEAALSLYKQSLNRFGVKSK